MSEHLPLPNHVVQQDGKSAPGNIAPQRPPAAKKTPVIHERDVLNALECLNLEKRAQWQPDHEGDRFSWLQAYVSIYAIEMELCRLHNIPTFKIIHRSVKRFLNRLRIKGKIDEIWTDLSSLRPYGEYEYCSNAVIERFPDD